MDQNRLAVGVPQSDHGTLATMRRAVIDHPENAIRRAVGFGLHDLLHQPAERFDSRLRLTPAQDTPPTDIPGSQVLQGSSAFILMFDTHRTPRPSGQRGMTSDSSLNTGLLIRADDEILATQRFPFPGPCVQVQDSPRFLGELGIAREDPIVISPGFDGVSVEDSPDGAGADRSTQSDCCPRGQV